MSKTDDNEEARKFLGKPDPSDDFEREALEGFRMAGTGGAFDKTKRELDGRMAVLFNGEKKRTGVFYWAAAATVLLFLFAALYVFNDVPVKKEPLVIKDVRLEKQPARPQSSAVITENAPEPEFKPLQKQTERKKGTAAEGPEEAKAEPLTPVPVAEDEDHKSMAAAVPETEPVAATAMQADVAAPPANAAQAREEAGLKKRSVNNEKQAARYESSGTALAPAAAPSNPDRQSPAYPGGELALRSFLKKNLPSALAGRNIDATLHLSTEGKVTRSELSDPSAFSGEEIKQINETMMKLESFTMGSPNQARYFVRYRP